jgi:hypothetical protein
MIKHHDAFCFFLKVQRQLTGCTDGLPVILPSARSDRPEKIVAPLHAH